MTNRPGAAGPLRIATVGFQGFGNIGDEAILTGIESALTGTGMRVTTVFSGPDPASVMAFPDARRIAARRHLPNRSALRILRRTDLLVLAGGGIFNDHWTAVVPRYAAWVFAARLAGARVAWVGVGVGPIRRGWLRWLARRAARASSVILVRDRPSAELLGSSSSPRVIPDPAMFNPRPTGAASTRELGLVVRGPTRRDERHAEALLAAIVDVAAAARARGARPVLLTMAGAADDRFVDALRTRLQRAGLDDVAREALGPTPSAALERIAQLSGLITVRLHGLLLAALAGVPAVPIAYDEKVRTAAEQLGLGDLVVMLNDVARTDLLARLDAATGADRRSLVAERVDALRAERDAVGAALIAIGRRR